MQIIRRNFGLKLLSVTLAVIGWAYFRFGSNPGVAAHFDQQVSVPIVAANLPQGYIAHYTDKEAVVTVATKRGQPPVKPDEIKAVLDLANRGAGIYNVPVQLVAPSIVVQSLSPASVSLTIERIDQQNYRVSLHYVGAQNNIVVGETRVLPVLVNVQGPTSLLSQIAGVRVDVPFPNAPRMFDEMVRPIPVDSAGQEITGIDVSPDLTRVQVHFVAGTGAKPTK